MRRKILRLRWMAITIVPMPSCRGIAGSVSVVGLVQRDLGGRVSTLCSTILWEGPWELQREGGGEQILTDLQRLPPSPHPPPPFFTSLHCPTKGGERLYLRAERKHGAEGGKEGTSVRTISAAPCAAGVAPATAMPTLAALRAGASFTPSPVIPINMPLACIAWTSANLCSGYTCTSWQTSSSTCGLVYYYCLRLCKRQQEGGALHVLRLDSRCS